MQNSIINVDGRTKRGAEYSKEFSDSIAGDLDNIPVPLLGPFFAGQCRKYLELRHATFAMAAEQVVDGMDLDKAWCEQHMRDATPEELNFAFDLVAGKASRIDYFWPDKITCFIDTEEERQRILKIPGRNI